jgi:hypothetical protein
VQEIRIGEHASHFFGRTVIVAIRITPIGPQVRILAAVDRSQTPVSARDTKQEQRHTLNLKALYIGLSDERDIHDLPVVQKVEKVTPVLLSFLRSKPIGIERTVLFLDTQPKVPEELLDNQL